MPTFLLPLKRSLSTRDPTRGTRGGGGVETQLDRFGWKKEGGC